MIAASNLSKRYQNSDREALKEFSYQFDTSGLYMITGESGAGKSTLLYLLAGLDNPSGGTILYNDTDVNKLTEHELVKIRNEQMGFVFQDFNLISSLNVFDNLKVVLDIQTWENKTDKDVTESINRALKFVGLDGFQNRHVQQLSGGELQRVAVARALVKNPKVIFADEPTGNLDKKNSDTVFELLKKISETCLVIVVTHDRESAVKYGDYIFRIDDGSLAESIDLRNTKDTVFDICFNSDGTETVIEKANAIRVSDVILEKLNSLKTGYSKIVMEVTKSKGLRNERNGATSEDRIVSVGRFPVLSGVRFALANLKKSWLKAVLTTCMLVISLSILLITGFFSSNSAYGVIKRYIESSDLTEVYLKKKATYSAGGIETFERVLTGGKEMTEKIRTEFNGDVFVMARNIEFCSQSGNGQAVSRVMIDPRNPDPSNYVWGNAPTKDDEIVVTDVFAKALGVAADNDNKIFLLNGVNVKICGVLYTGLNIPDGNEETFTEEYTEDDSYTEEYYVRRVYVSDGFAEYCREQKEIIELKGANIFLYHPESYSSNVVSFSPSELITDSALICGRLPEKADEVIISDCFASNNGYVGEAGYNRLLNSRFEYKDIRSEELAEYCADLLNLKEFFPDGVKIVGIFHEELGGTGAGFYIFREVFDSISTEYYQHYFWNQTGVRTRSRLNRKMAFCRTEGITFFEPQIDRIMDFYDSVADYRKAIVAICVAMIALSVLVVYNYAEKSTTSNKREIGTLRALGLSGKAGAMIYYIEILMLYIASLISSTVIAGVIIAYINNSYRQEFENIRFNICYFNVAVWGVIAIVGLVISVVSVAIPILLFARKKPMELIKALD